MVSVRKSDVSMYSATTIQYNFIDAQVDHFSPCCHQIPSKKYHEEPRIYFGSWFEGRQSTMAETQEHEAAGYIVCPIKKHWAWMLLFSWLQFCSPFYSVCNPHPWDDAPPPHWGWLFPPQCNFYGKTHRYIKRCVYHVFPNQVNWQWEWPSFQPRQWVPLSLRCWAAQWAQLWVRQDLTRWNTNTDKHLFLGCSDVGYMHSPHLHLHYFQFLIGLTGYNPSWSQEILILSTCCEPNIANIVHQFLKQDCGKRWCWLSLCFSGDTATPLTSSGFKSLQTQIFHDSKTSTFSPIH